MQKSLPSHPRFCTIRQEIPTIESELKQARFDKELSELIEAGWVILDISYPIVQQAVVTRFVSLAKPLSSTEARKGSTNAS